MHKIDRKFMPQIDEANLVELLAHLAKIGVNCIFKTVHSSFLTNHQLVDETKVNGIMGNKAALDKPLLVAERGCVLDGNHRAAAHVKLGSESVIAIVIPLAYEDALLALASSPNSYSYGDGNEHPISI